MCFFRVNISWNKFYRMEQFEVEFVHLTSINLPFIRSICLHIKNKFTIRVTFCAHIERIGTIKLNLFQLEIIRNMLILKTHL